MKRGVRKELLQEGASKNEAESLARLAEQLAAAKPRGLSARAKQHMYDELPFNMPTEHPVFRWAMAGSLAGAMALLAFIFLPGTLHRNAAPADDSSTQALIQPVETQLQELDTQIEQLQQQPDVDEAQLQQTEDKYQRTLDNFKKKYQNNKQFKNYDWNKWQRNYQLQKHHQ